MTTLRSTPESAYGGRRLYNPDTNIFERNTYNYLRLIWAEQDVVLEYTLKYNQTRRGFWIASGPQGGTTGK